jgi:hypothetical protein
MLASSTNTVYSEEGKGTNVFLQASISASRGKKTTQTPGMILHGCLLHWPVKESVTDRMFTTYKGLIIWLQLWSRTYKSSDLGAIHTTCRRWRLRASSGCSSLSWGHATVRSFGKSCAKTILRPITTVGLDCKSLDVIACGNSSDLWPQQCALAYCHDSLDAEPWTQSLPRAIALNFCDLTARSPLNWLVLCEAECCGGSVSDEERSVSDEDRPSCYPHAAEYTRPRACLPSSRSSENTMRRHPGLQPCVRWQIITEAETEADSTCGMIRGADSLRGWQRSTCQEVECQL